MRLRVACAQDAVDLRDYLRDRGLISFVDHAVDVLVHVAGTCDSYREQRLIVTDAVGQWEQQGHRSVDLLEFR